MYGGGEKISGRKEAVRLDGHRYALPRSKVATPTAIGRPTTTDILDWDRKRISANPTATRSSCRVVYGKSKNGRMPRQGS